MSETKELLDYQIYPALFEVIDTALPEFGFRKIASGWQSTTGLKITGETGKAGKVYVYENNISRLIDYTRESISVWDYLQQRDGCDNRQVLETLASLSGLSLPKLAHEQTDLYKQDRLKSQIWEDANTFFINCLSGRDNKHAKDNKAQEIREYLIKDRGYKANEFQLPGQEREIGRSLMEFGYIPSVQATKDYLVQKGYDVADVDVTIQFSTTVGYTHIITVPFRDAVGRIRGMVVRCLKDEKPKYLYSTGLKKSDTLFNLKFLRYGQEDITIVEGILDALVSQVRGVENVVAIGGVNLNNLQIEELKKRGVKRVTLCLDNDMAGREGTLGAIDLLLKAGLVTFMARLPDGIKDPDQLIREKGIEAFQKILHSVQASYKYLLEETLDRYKDKYVDGQLSDMDTDSFMEDVVEIANKISDPINKEKYVELLSQEVPCASQNAISDTIARIKYKKDRVLQEKEFENLLRQVKKLKSQGDINGSLRQIIEQSRQIIQKDKEVEFDRLLLPMSEQGVTERMKLQPTSVEAGLSIGDEMLLLPSGALSIFAAPTSHGKTSMLINLCLNVVSSGKRVHLFSYEEDGDTILLKTLNTFIGKDLCRNNLRAIKSFFRENTNKYFGDNEKIFDDDRIRFFQELVDSSKLNIHYTNYSSNTLIEAIRYLHRVTDIGVVFIDYMQLLHKEVGRYNSRPEELKQVCLDLKDLAVETGLPIVLGAQFNRVVTNHLKVHPTNIGEAGDIERIANLIVGIWNNNFEIMGSEGEKSEIAKQDMDKKGTLFTKVLKNRDGVVGRWRLLEFNGNTGKITNEDGFNDIPDCR